jgi:hypothetical protein
MLRKIAIALLWVGLTLPTAPGMANQRIADQVSVPDQALTARFTAFFTEVLAGRIPSGNLSALMKAGFTSEMLSQIDGFYGTFGAFQKLQFVSQDSLGGYQRYHYTAVFDKGTQGVLFVTDSSGAIAGFFKDQNS